MCVCAHLRASRKTCWLLITKGGAPGPFTVELNADWLIAYTFLSSEARGCFDRSDAFFLIDSIRKRLNVGKLCNRDEISVVVFLSVIFGLPLASTNTCHWLCVFVIPQTVDWLLQTWRHAWLTWWLPQAPFDGSNGRDMPTWVVITTCTTACGFDRS